MEFIFCFYDNIPYFCKKIIKKMKHRKIDKTKFSEEARRKDEIASHGKMVSLRCSCVHKSKKDYNRQEHKKKTSQMMRDFCED